MLTLMLMSSLGSDFTELGASAFGAGVGGMIRPTSLVDIVDVDLGYIMKGESQVVNIEATFRVWCGECNIQKRKRPTAARHRD